jgi:hypothetical protein
MTTAYSAKKRFTNKNKNKQKFSDTKGFWEWNGYQKPHIKSSEEAIKSKLSTGNFDHSKIDSMINPKLSLIQSIKDKQESNLKLNSKERLILENHIQKTNNLISKDLENLGKLGLRADVKTDIGRIHKLFLVAINQVKSKNYNMVFYIYQKLSEFEIPEDILKKYRDTFSEMKSIIATLDTIELQFNKFYGNMPPLNTQGFVKLDDFQIDVISNINKNLTTIVQAPTSAGKSILTGYLYTKNIKALVVVPTDILCWQMAAMIGNIMRTDIPILTKTHQTNPSRKEMVEKINKIGIVVGTPTELMDYLPLISVDFDWVVIDEIHMIGKKECSEMESIVKLYSDKPILALSATIGNVDELKNWFLQTGQKEVDIIKCEKRFFNLQRFYYDNKKDCINRIHPLSMVSIDDFIDKSILKKSLNPTPPDIYNLYEILSDNFDLGDLEIETFFDTSERITLDKANLYFSKLIEFMITKIEKSKKKIINILKNFKPANLNDYDVDFVNFCFRLKNEEKIPAIIFHLNSYNCLEKIKEFSTNIKRKEEEKYPNRFKEINTLLKKAKALEKKRDQAKIDDMGEKKRAKAMMEEDILVEPEINISLNEPHSDFIFNKNQYFSQYQIEQWARELKKFFPNNGSEYHYIIDLLYRGVGVYVKGLPDPYLRIVQNLACDKRLAIVFSDDSLVFGVSMPFRTSVITDDPQLDPMMYHQMAGRAGRRGLDKEGNVIFVEQSWNKIKDLSVSVIPSIVGEDTMYYGYLYGNRFNNDSRWDNICKNFLNKNRSESECKEFYETIEYNTQKDNAWEFVNSDDSNFNHMLWKFRNNDTCFRVPILIQYIKKFFKNCNPTNEATQIECSKLLSFFLNIKEIDEDCNYNLQPYDKFDINIHEYLESLALDIPINIDGRIYYSIQKNKLYSCDTNEETNKLRETLMEFGNQTRIVQHYFFHCNEISITRLLGKLLTRILWIYLSSSPIMMH